VLVIDDLQFLQGKSTQAEFCHTLNALIDSGRQVVVAGDRPPSDLESLDDRVRSRLAGGLVVEMGGLEEDLRLEILKSRVGAARLHHPGFDVPPAVLAFIAKTVTHNGRDLDGALNRLLAHNKLTGQPVTMEMAELAVRDLIRPQEPKRIKIEDIQRAVARHYNVSRADMLSSRRTANVVRPRQIAMYLAKTLTLRSLPEIGRRFGGRDHTTVLHAVRKIETLADTDKALGEEIEILKRLLMELGGRLAARNARQPLKSTGKQCARHRKPLRNPPSRATLPARFSPGRTRPGQAARAAFPSVVRGRT
jgi:chromosomal replication initiator protein